METFDTAYVMVSGTSFSAPLAALSYITALQMTAYLFNDVLGANPLANDDTRSRVADIAYRAIMYGSENVVGDSAPLPNVDKLTNLVWDKYNGYGCIDVHDSAVLAGAISLLDVLEQEVYTNGDSVNLDLRAKVMISKISDVWDSITSKLSSIFSVKYYVYRVIDDGSLRFISSGFLDISSKDRSSGVIEYRGSLRLWRSSSSMETYIIIAKLVAGKYGMHLVFKESDILYKVVFEGTPSIPPMPPY